MTRSADYHVNLNRFIRYLNTVTVDLPQYHVARPVRLKAISRGVKARLGRIRANKVFDQIMQEVTP